eukprot:m.82681 g.82681  ORF g.82681 m.82681 type:complete len:595 (+) comp14739_c0_seq1:323-2107(+)
MAEEHAEAAESSAKPSKSRKHGKEQDQPPPDFWEDGWRHVPKRIEVHAELLEELAKMAGERAALERKIAKELSKFSKRWEERFQKAELPEGSSLLQACMAVPTQAAQESAVHTELQTALESKLKQSITETRKTAYARSFGKFKKAKENIKGFEAARKPWVKVVVDVKKSANTYRQKKEDLHELHHTRELAKTVQSDSSETDMRKLNEKIAKAEAAAQKAEDAYHTKIQAATTAVAQYEAAMRDQLKTCQSEEAERIEYVKQVLLEYASVITVSNHQALGQSFSAMNSTVQSAQAAGDLAKFETSIGAVESPKAPVFVEWAPNQDAPVLGSTDGKSFPGHWFVKAGETKSSRAHKRFFVLKGTDLEYYQTVKMGVPTKKRGTIPLHEATAIQLAEKQINIVTNKRTWHLTSKKPEDAARWADMLADAVGLSVTTVQPDDHVVAAAAAVLAAPAAHDDDDVADDEHGDAGDVAGGEASSVVTDDAAVAAAAVAGTAAVAAGAVVAADAVGDSNATEPEGTGPAYGPEHHAAAVTIQRHARGYIARKNIEKENKAATKIQHAYRAHIKTLHAAAVVVQAAVRGHLLRSQMRKSSVFA